MKILQIHNKYTSGLSGEDTVVKLEHDLLTKHGEEVLQLFATNVEAGPRGLVANIETGINSIWSRYSYKRISDAIDGVKPDILHVHNTFAKLSPSIYWAANKKKIPVILTLHNFRLTCAGSMLLRNGSPCEECVGCFPWAAIKHRCQYANSTAVGISIAATQAIHHTIGTYRNKVNAFIALTQFAKSVMIHAGLPEQKIYVKPNFMIDPLTDLDAEPLPRKKQFLYAGQISNFKGVDLLVSAWKKVSPKGYQLIIVGDGAERNQLQNSMQDPNIIWLGRRPHQEIFRLMRQSQWLVMPTKCYEGFPMVILESISVGTPVIVPNHGPFPTIITSGKQGLTHQPNDVNTLAEAIQKASAMNPEKWESLSKNSRDNYLKNYTPDINYQQLMDIYTNTIQNAKY